MEPSKKCHFPVPLLHRTHKIVYKFVGHHTDTRAYTAIFCTLHIGITRICVKYFSLSMYKN